MNLVKQFQDKSGLDTPTVEYYLLCASYDVQMRLLIADYLAETDTRLSVLLLIDMRKMVQ